MILYNEQDEFLIHHSGPPNSWRKVERDTFQEEPYFIRAAEDPQAFAVRVGALWAGSLNTLSHMNQAMEKMLREKLPPEKLTPAVFKSMNITPVQHVVALLHEAFHAFQAESNSIRFMKANSSYSYEKQYPFKDDKIKAAWNQEGSFLNAALREKDESQRRRPGDAVG